MKARSITLLGSLAITSAIAFTTLAQGQSPYLADYSISGTRICAGFTPRETNLVLGQPIEAIFTVQNLGPTNFTFLFGCDYRATGRHDSFKITATNSDGIEMPDPVTRRPAREGGLGALLNLQPGEGFTNVVDLTEFRVIDKPGVYTFTCSYGFGKYDLRYHRQTGLIVPSRFVLTIRGR